MESVARPWYEWQFEGLETAGRVTIRLPLFFYHNEKLPFGVNGCEANDYNDIDELESHLSNIKK